MAYLYYPAVTVQPVPSMVTLYPAATYLPTSYYVTSVPLYCYSAAPPCCHCVRIAHARANRRSCSGTKARRGRSSTRSGSGRSDEEERLHSTHDEDVTHRPRGAKRSVSPSPSRGEKIPAAKGKNSHKKEQTDDDEEWEVEGTVDIYGNAM